MFLFCSSKKSIAVRRSGFFLIGFFWQNVFSQKSGKTLRYDKNVIKLFVTSNGMSKLIKLFTIRKKKYHWFLVWKIFAELIKPFLIIVIFFFVEKGENFLLSCSSLGQNPFFFKRAFRIFVALGFCGRDLPLLGLVLRRHFPRVIGGRILVAVQGEVDLSPAKGQK